MVTLWLLLAFVAMSSPLSDGARILAFAPFPAKSHQRVIQPLLRELAMRGHQVVSYSPHPMDNPPKNYKHVLIPDYMPIMKKQMVEMTNSTGKDNYIKWKSPISKIFMIFFKGMIINFSEWVFKLKEFQDLIHSNETFDAVVLETTFFQENVIALGHRFKAPVIEFIPAGNFLWSYWLHGNPRDTSYIVELLWPFTDHMSYFERICNTGFTLLNMAVSYNLFMPKYEEIMNKYVIYPGWETRPSMMEMISNTSLVLINTHYSLNYPYPYAPHIKEVGGLNVVQPKPLPKDLQEFMDGAKDGVVYFTLGSHIDVSEILGEDLKVVFAQVFSELKQRVLWKWEFEYPGLPPNIKISKWFPQQDILAHKNIKLFITHGGLLSTTEAIYQGVPTVGIPIAADQFKNVQHMEDNKYGLLLDLENITYSSLKWAINEILDNPEYGENAKKRSQLFRDKPETALETAVFWTEYVIRHKGAHHLKPAIATMPWYQQAMIDIYAALAVIILLPLYIGYLVLRRTCKLLCKFMGRQEKTSSNLKKKKQ